VTGRFAEVDSLGSDFAVLSPAEAPCPSAPFGSEATAFNFAGWASLSSTALLAYAGTASSPPMTIVVIFMLTPVLLWMLLFALAGSPVMGERHPTSWLVSFISAQRESMVHESARV